VLFGVVARVGIVAGFGPAGPDAESCPLEHPAVAISTISTTARMSTDLVMCSTITATRLLRNFSDHRTGAVAAGSSIRALLPETCSAADG
jgi:hypothetical protein